MFGFVMIAINCHNACSFTGVFVYYVPTYRCSDYINHTAPSAFSVLLGSDIKKNEQVLYNRKKWQVLIKGSLAQVK